MSLFASSKSYGSAFDNDIWKPEGMPDAVGSDQGLDSLVGDMYKQHDEQVRFAGDALATYGGLRDAKKMYDAEGEAAKIRYDKQKESKGGGGMGGIGQIAGIAGQALKFLPAALGLFCDIRLKEDVTQLHSTGEVDDQLASMALAVHHLRNVCS